METTLDGIGTGTNYVVTSFYTFGQTVFAGTITGDLYSTTNNGVSWDHVFKVPENDGRFRKINVVSLDEDQLYASLAYNSNYTALYTSNDNGATWQEIGIANFGINNLVLQEGALFAATESGVYTSVAQNQDWVQIGNELPTGAYQTIASDGTTLYISSHSRGVYRSDDDGNSWSSMDVNGDYRRKIYCKPTGEPFLADKAGVYKFDFASSRWQSKNEGFPMFTITDVLRVDRTIYVGTESKGVWASLDYGNSWDNLNFNFDFTGPIHSLAYHQDTLYAGTTTSLFYKTSGQRGWEEYKSDLDGATDITAIKDNLFVLTRSNTVYRRTADQSNWRQASAGLPRDLIANHMTSSGSNLILQGREDYINSLYLSKDLGHSWSKIEGEAFNGRTMTDLAVSEDYVYIIQNNNLTKNVLRSGDNGVTWTKVGVFFRDRADAVVANKSSVVVANELGQVFVANHNDLQWREISNNYPTKSSLSDLSLNNEVLTASFHNNQGMWIRSLGEALVFPQAPTNLTSTNVSEDGIIDLTWEDQSDSETGFVIFRANSESYSYEGFKAIDTVDSNVTVYRDSTKLFYPTNLTYYRVVATTNGNTSEVHETLTVVVLRPKCYTAHHTDSSFVLRQSHLNTADTLAVDISTESSFETFLPDFENRLVEVDSLFIQGIPGQDTYYVRYRPYYKGHHGSYSETLVVKLAPPAPTGFVVQNAGPRRLYFEWIDNSDNETGFLIEYKGAGYADVEYDSLVQVAANETSVMVEDERVSSSIHYTFRVAAINKGGRSYSEEGDIVTAIDKQHDEPVAADIFPNPAHHQLIVPGVSVAPVRIKDIAGRLLTIPQRTSPKGTHLDVSALPPGIYFAEVIVDEKTVVKRFIRK